MKKIIKKNYVGKHYINSQCFKEKKIIKLNFALVNIKKNIIDKDNLKKKQKKQKEMKKEKEKHSSNSLQCFPHMFYIYCNSLEYDILCFITGGSIA